MSAARPVASVVLVSYGSEETLGAAVASVPADLEVIVVDQHPQGHAAETTLPIRPDALTIRSGANRGFGAGCNLGAANATGDVLIFLNPDAALHEGAAAILAAGSLAAGGALVGPTLLGEDGAPDTCARELSTPLRNAAHLLLPESVLPPALRQDVPPGDPRYARGGAVPYAQGACLAVGRAAFLSVGGFDEEFFLYGEEEHLSVTLREQRGLETLIEPAALVTHIGHTSTDALSSFATEQYFRSLVLTYRKRGGAARALAGASLLGLAVAVLLLSRPLRLLVGYRPDESVAWCGAALRGISAGYRRRGVVPPVPGRSPAP